MTNTIRPRDEFGGNEATAHLRYVQQYATDSDPDQPVQVKLLRWNGSAFATYGAEFRIGDASHGALIGSGQKFWVVWKRDAARWMPVVGTSTETLRLIRGLAKGTTITADDATFVIDNVIPLAGGLDPVAGNAATEITVQNVNKEAFADNEPITAIYDGANWEVLLVERYRLIMCQATSTVSTGTASFSVDNIEVLASGRDPRSNPASAAETITVYNEHSQAFANDEKLIAAYNVATHHWEALPKTAAAGGTTLSLAVVYSTIAAATVSGSDIDPGTGVIKKFTRPGTPGNNWVFVDSEVTAWNIFFDAFPTDCIVWVDSENYVVSAGCTLMP